MQSKNIALLGCTGSIGKSTLKVAAHLKNFVKIKALAAHSNIELLKQQAQLFHPEVIAVYDEKKAIQLQKQLPSIPVVTGMDGIKAVATHSSVDMVVVAMPGFSALSPLISAIEAGKTIGLANKEALVAAGQLILDLARKKGANIIPIDSEHSAIFQCLNGVKKQEVSRIILTASGGPFCRFSFAEFETITPELALKHPNWIMGRKISIDSATLMNKGLEVIEAHYLFDLPLSQIEIIIHPQSIIHSLVEFVDGSLLAHMSESSMLLPIQYALTYPERKRGPLSPIDFHEMSKLEFFLPDYQKFPCLSLALEAIKIGGTMPCFLSSANEMIVEKFLAGKIKWVEIAHKLEKLMGMHTPIHDLNLEIIYHTDREARERVLSV